MQHNFDLVDLTPTLTDNCVQSRVPLARGHYKDLWSVALWSFQDSMHWVFLSSIQYVFTMFFKCRPKFHTTQPFFG